MIGSSATITTTNVTTIISTAVRYEHTMFATRFASVSKAPASSWATARTRTSIAIATITAVAANHHRAMRGTVATLITPRSAARDFAPGAMDGVREVCDLPETCPRPTGP